MLTTLGPSVIRTVVPLAVGLLLTQAAKHLGVKIDEGLTTEVVTVVVSAAYYALARVLEENVSRWFGLLLGKRGAPTYKAPAAPSDESPTGAVSTEDTAGVPEGEPVTVEPVEYDPKHDAAV